VIRIVRSGEEGENIFIYSQLLLTRHVEQTEETLLSAHMVGDTPPPALGGDIIPPFFCSIAVIYYGIRWTGGNTWKGALPTPFTQKVTISRTSFKNALAVAFGGMELGRGGDIAQLCLCF
jgi:hypothetical protein